MLEILIFGAVCYFKIILIERLAFKHEFVYILKITVIFN